MSAETIAQSVAEMTELIESAARTHADIGYAHAIRDVEMKLRQSGAVTFDDLLLLLNEREGGSDGKPKGQKAGQAG